MRIPLFLRAPVLVLAFALAVSPALAAGKPTPAERDAAVQLQIFLDEQNFGPGKIDGSYGGFTKLSWTRYQLAQGQKPKPDFDVHSAPLSGIQPIYNSYTITAEDLSSLGKVPGQVALQAKEKSLPYTTLAELLGERFHSSVQFLRDLNAPKKLDQLKAGDEVTVPNIPPFELGAVTAAREAAAAAKKTAAAKPSETPPATAAPIDISKRFVHVSVKDAYLEVHDGDKIVAAFPITPGSKAIPSPIGEWKIESKTLLPEFRYDKAMLLHGERSSDFHQLPPGPNNPVGITWIALNRKGIGLHGTNEPDTIGRAASHGCIRLANWDAFKLYGMVEKGMRVVIE